MSATDTTPAEKPKRLSISKKLRFEVFKRDGFKCQYCGAASPDVLLEVDHIHPVSKSGKNDILNLLTACKPCNAGKSDRVLTDDSAVKKQQAQLAELHARREQLEMMLQWRDALKDIDADQYAALAVAWSKAVPGWSLNDKGEKEARKLLKRFGLQTVLDAIDTASVQYVEINTEGKATQESVSRAWSKVGGICALSSMPEDQRRLYYVKAILVKRLNYVPYSVMDDLKRALEAGVPIEDLEFEAKHTRNWTAFQGWLQG